MDLYSGQTLLRVNEDSAICGGGGGGGAQAFSSLCDPNGVE